MANRQIKIYCLVLISFIFFSAAQAETFTIAVLPDTQKYCKYNEPQPASTAIYKGETQFIVNNRTAMNIVFVSHVGDVIDTHSYQPSEWPRAQEAMNILRDAGIPMGMVAGNHDYDYQTDSIIYDSAYWNYYFGPSTSYFNGKSWYGGAYINETDTSGMSSWQTFSACGWNFLHLSFEVNPSDDVLNWASGIIAAHPGYRVIVTTHIYLKNNGDRYTDVNYRATYPANSGQQMWDEFIKVNPQIFMVLSGHTCYANRRMDLNNNGGKVYQILSDYQDAPSDSSDYLGRGGGWFRLMEFNTDSGIVHVRTYSSLWQKYSTDSVFTDGSSYARTYAPFNYADGGTGSLLLSTNSASSDFYIRIDPVCMIGPESGNFVDDDDCTVDYKDLAFIVERWLTCGSSLPGICGD